MATRTRVARLKAIAAALLVGGSLAASTPAVAQSKAAELRQQIVGDWTLVEVVLEQDGKRQEPFGANPKGFMTYSVGGRFSYVLLRSDLPKIASNNRTDTTPEESKAVAAGVLAAYGTYVVEDAEGMLLSRIDAGTFPNWNGTQQKRQITIQGDELRVVNPTPPRGGGTAYLVWKRAS